MPEIEILSLTKAKGRWPMTDRLWTEGAGPGRLPFKTFEGWGVYHDTYRRTAAGWRIASTRLERIKVIVG
ncbi:MAG: nuclear transport factor 2 family protein [Aliidongia sp.]